MRAQKAAPEVEYKGERRNRFARDFNPKDELLNVPMAKIRVKSITRGLIVCDEVIDEGEYELTVYEKDIPYVKSLVETMPEKVKEAEELVAEENLELQGKENPNRTYPNVPATYYLLTRKHMKPLLFADVVETGLPAPQSKEDAKAVAQTKAVVQAVMDANKALASDTSPQTPKARKGKMSKLAERLEANAEVVEAEEQ